jgi:hypothetical protein
MWSSPVYAIFFQEIHLMFQLREMDEGKPRDSMTIESSLKSFSKSNKEYKNILCELY